MFELTFQGSEQRSLFAAALCYEDIDWLQRGDLSLIVDTDRETLLDLLTSTMTPYGGLCEVL